MRMRMPSDNADSKKSSEKSLKCAFFLLTI